MITNKQLEVLSPITIDINFKDIALKIKTSGNNPEILKIARKVFNKAKNIWKPMAVYQWFEFENIGRDNTGRIIQNSACHVDFDFGHSFQFVSPARYALVSTYTVGQELELESKKASSKGDILEAYFFDIIGLAVLDQAGQTIKNIAEKQAVKQGMGVSPFLSPGSVHGWELEDQIRLCSLLPLKKINVKIQNDAVLLPFKTVSCLIGLGPGYSNAKVGTTCQVCSKNNDCQMKQI